MINLKRAVLLLPVYIAAMIAVDVVFKRSDAMLPSTSPAKRDAITPTRSAM